MVLSEINQHKYSRSLRELVKFDILGGYGIVRKNLGSGLLDRLHSNVGGSEEAPEFALDKDGSCDFDSSSGLHCGSDTVEFDTESFNLDLMINASKMLQVAVLVPASTKWIERLNGVCEE
jgi:hypothetical protein